MSWPKTTAWISVLATLSVACAETGAGDRKRVSLKGTVPVERAAAPAGTRPLRVAVGAVTTPLDRLACYRQFIDFIGEKMDMPVRFVTRDEYSEVYDLLKLGRVDLAFISGKPYVEGHDDFGLELLAVPVVRGKTTYRTYYIVPAASPTRSFDGLRGRRFAFVDPMSNSGGLVPLHRLAAMGETADSFFGHYLYSFNHELSIRMVALGLVDGAAVDGNVWEYLANDDPSSTSGTRVIDRSRPFGIPPVVVPPGLDAKLKKRLSLAILTAHMDDDGRRILDGMHVDRFVEASDESYDSIRRIGRETTDLLFGR